MIFFKLRSIPKHAVLEIDPNKEAEKRLRHCIFEPEVYDKMLSDSLLVCDMLEKHLDDCIVSVRAKSPQPSSPEPIIRHATTAFTTNSPERKRRECYVKNLGIYILGEGSWRRRSKKSERKLHFAS